MAPKPKMNVLMRGGGHERFDRQPIKTNRLNAPSFTNGRMRSGKLAAVFFHSWNNQALTCHADVLRYWSPKLRAIVEHQEREIEANKPGAPMPKTATFISEQASHLITFWLPDVNIKTFAIFLDWAMCDKVPETASLLNVAAPADIREGESWMSFYNRQPEAAFLEAYIFARRYKIRDLRNDMFDCLWEVVYMRTKGKEDDPSGNLMPSLLVLHRAVTTLGNNDPARVFLTVLFHWFVPNIITSERERLCAVELHEKYGFLDMLDTERKGPIRKGPEEMDNGIQDALYCFKYHEHLGYEALECWAAPDESRKYWRPRLRFNTVVDKGDSPSDDSEAEMTDNSTVDGTDDDMTDDGLPDLSSAFNTWDSVEPDGDSEDESFNDDAGYGDEEEDEMVTEDNDEIDADVVDAEEEDEVVTEDNDEMDADVDDVEEEEDDAEDYEGEMKASEEGSVQGMIIEIDSEDETFVAELESTEREAEVKEKDADNSDMTAIEQAAENAKQHFSETMMAKGKTCKEVLGPELWDFPTELDAETMDRLASPNEVPGGFQGDVAERYQVPW